MNLFDKYLEESESLFIDEISLDPDFIPKEIPHRENQQHYIAECISPLFQKRSGKNLLITGKPGIGKTLAIKHIFMELESKTDEITPIYINCWKKDSSFKILNEIADQINYKWTHNKRTDELMKIISDILNKKSVVFCLDEIDKVREIDILYSITEDIPKKTILLITNDHEWISKLDQRIRSRLSLEHLDFHPYTYGETKSILKMRKDLAFQRNIFNQDALELITNKTFALKDIRTGLALLKESGNIAERKLSKQINMEHTTEAINKLLETEKKDLTPEEKNILDIAKNNSGKTIKEIYDIYVKQGGDKTYTTLYRKLSDLQKNAMLDIKNIGGTSSSTVHYRKKLTDF